MSGEVRTVLVTGGSQGIGFAAAKRLAGEGHRVAIAARTPGHLATAGKDLAAAGIGSDRAMLVEVDAADEASLRRGLDEVRARWGDIDILVNNAGKGVPPESFGPATVAGIRATLEVNLFAAAFLCQEVLPAMKTRGWGRIVNVASTAGLGAPRRLMAYSVSKAALVAFTKSLAVDVADQGINVNAVAPGPIVTDNYRASKGEAAIAERARSIPAGRLGRPEDVAEAIAFLASPGAAHITGQVIAIDGGEYAAGLYSAMWAQARPA